MSQKARVGPAMPEPDIKMLREGMVVDISKLGRRDSGDVGKEGKYEV